MIDPAELAAAHAMTHKLLMLLVVVLMGLTGVILVSHRLLHRRLSTIEARSLRTLTESATARAGTGATLRAVDELARNVSPTPTPGAP